ncbi:MAG: hypothetical protein RIF46_15105, partial [Cyclobacteriaceae bacterium]
MKTFITIMMIFCFIRFSYGQKINLDPSTLNELENWFGAWNLVYKDVYNLEYSKPVDMVLFDQTYVYSTSTISGNNGMMMLGPSPSGQQINWFKKTHNGMLTFPDGSTKKIGIMAFARQNESGAPFFVMPLTSYWYQNNVDDHGLGLDTLVLCVFLHEFTHTQQMQNISEIENHMEAYATSHPDVGLSDDLMQDYYQDDSLYLKKYLKEVDLFKRATQANRRNEQIRLTAAGLKMLSERHKKCLEVDHRELAVIDNFYLTFEGIGQYTAFAWLAHPNGGGLSTEKA